MAKNPALRFLGIIGIIILVLVAGGAIYLYSQNKPLPNGEAGQAAEELTAQMLDAVNIQAWDSISLIKWNFMGTRQHTWDKKRKYAEVKWDEYRVLLNLKNKKSVVFKEGQQLSEGEDFDKATQTAYGSWVNDAYWLNAVATIRNPDTDRLLVKTEESGSSLLVTYNKGGVTPGDSYQFILNPETKRPSGFNMWVSVIPVKGISWTWAEWKQLSSGAWIATKFDGMGLSIELTDVQEADSIEQFFPEGDPFLAAGI